MFPVTMMKRAFLPLLAAALACSLSAVRAQAPAADASPAASPALDPIKDIRIVLHTDKGDVEATLFASKAPLTTANFLNLAQQHFYDGLKFHRVIPGFMSQGGDPEGTGRGGPGYTFNDEPNGDRRFDKPGVFAMANRGTNTNGSQFFITHDAVAHLNDGGGAGHYTIFGQVTKGQDLVTNMGQADHIKAIDILDSTVPLFTSQAKQLEEWNLEIKSGKKS